MKQLDASRANLIHDQVSISSPAFLPETVHFSCTGDSCSSLNLMLHLVMKEPVAVIS